jgi:carbamate kinase
LEGVEAVIDKDLTAALLAERLGADALLLLTDVVAVETNYGQADSSPIAHARAADLRSNGFAAGSMGPKVEAACRFAGRTGGTAAIGSLTDAEGVLAGTSGTRVTR